MFDGTTKKFYFIFECTVFFLFNLVINAVVYTFHPSAHNGTN